MSHIATIDTLVPVARLVDQKAKEIAMGKKIHYSKLYSFIYVKELAATEEFMAYLTAHRYSSSCRIREGVATLAWWL